MKKSFILILLSGILLLSCNGLKSIKSALTNASPYDLYVESLERADLLHASMAKAWLRAGSEVFDDSVVITVPFSESGFFQASNPQARSYRFRARDGQVLTVSGAIKTHHEASVFLDLFVRDDDAWDRIAFADSTFTITHEFSGDEECVLRVQPELLANAYYAVNISLTPVLVNPVYGATNRSIGSFYGASRDNGKRSHEGVDIFAPKGTPVVAPTDGHITRVGLNTLGGKVVWMKDPRRGHSYYFAHLDSQMVTPGMRVRQGHVLGLVGNTGNARSTPPHLHFGIYQSGSKDPLYYIHQMEGVVATLPVDTAFQQKPFRIRTARASLMSGPSSKLPVKTALKKNTYITVIGQSREWYRVSLPDASEGYVLKKQVADIEKGAHIQLDTTQVLLSAISSEAIPIAILDTDTTVEVLAHFDEYQFVKTEDGMAGWLYN